MDRYSPRRVALPEPGPEAAAPPVAEAVTAPAADQHPEESNGTSDVEARHWHALAGRKGAHRVHQLIKEGRLYEKEHGLNSGRQRLRQLLELGKLYEEEHGFRPARTTKRSKRLARMERQELLATLLECLLRLARPSFRAELARLVETFQAGKESHAM